MDLGKLKKVLSFRKQIFKKNDALEGGISNFPLPEGVGW